MTPKYFHNIPCQANFSFTFESTCNVNEPNKEGRQKGQFLFCKNSRGRTMSQVFDRIISNLEQVGKFLGNKSRGCFANRIFQVLNGNGARFSGTREIHFSFGMLNKNKKEGRGRDEIRSKNVRRVRLKIRLKIFRAPVCTLARIVSCFLNSTEHLSQLSSFPSDTRVS